MFDQTSIKIISNAVPPKKDKSNDDNRDALSAGYFNTYLVNVVLPNRDKSKYDIGDALSDELTIQLTSTVALPSHDDSTNDFSEDKIEKKLMLITVS